MDNPLMMTKIIYATVAYGFPSGKRYLTARAENEKMAERLRLEQKDGEVQRPSPQARQDNQST
jgi:hypothetical protein